MEQKSDIIFPEHVFFDAPLETAPAFIKGKLALHPAKFAKWAEAFQSDRGYVYLEVCESKKGGYYMRLDTFRHNAVKSKDAKNAVEENIDPAIEMSGEGEIDPDAIPF